MIEGIDIPGLLRKINFIISRLYDVFVKNTAPQISLINKTGLASVRGSVVRVDTAIDEAFILTGVDDQEAIGIVSESGIPDGSRCRITVSGVVDVLLKDGTAGTRGYWVKTSSVAGRADATLAAPPLGGVAQLDEHMQELGHCTQNVTAGTDKLCRMITHKN